MKKVVFIILLAFLCGFCLHSNAQIVNTCPQISLRTVLDQGLTARVGSISNNYRHFLRVGPFGNQHPKALRAQVVINLTDFSLNSTSGITDYITEATVRYMVRFINEPEVLTIRELTVSNNNLTALGTVDCALQNLSLTTKSEDYFRFAVVNIRVKTATGAVYQLKGVYSSGSALSAFDNAAVNTDDIQVLKKADEIITKALQIDTRCLIYYNGTTPGNESLIFGEAANNTKDFVLLSDNGMYSADSTEFEWVFVPKDCGINFTNAFTTFAPVRVITAGNRVRILPTFPAGSLYVRARRAGAWVTYPSAIDVASLARSGETLPNAALNWQNVITYTEDGRSKSVITYLDGTMRTRQTVTTSSTSPLTLRQENRFDVAGRPAMKTLPWAEKGYSFAFLPAASTIGNSKVAPSDIALAKENFYLDNSCAASKYYSNSRETFTNNFNMGGIADANGAVASVTHYTRDKTNRVIKQISPGNAKPIRTFYGSADKGLISLFSPFTSKLFNNLGDIKNYHKVETIDPNGQVSVQYTDFAGRVIASGIKCATPKNLLTVDPSSAAASSKDVELDMQSVFVNGNTESITTYSFTNQNTTGQTETFNWESSSTVAYKFSVVDNTTNTQLDDAAITCSFNGNNVASLSTGSFNDSYTVNISFNALANHQYSLVQSKYLSLDLSPVEVRNFDFSNTTQNNVTRSFTKKPDVQYQFWVVDETTGNKLSNVSFTVDDALLPIATQIVNGYSHVKIQFNAEGLHTYTLYKKAMLSNLIAADSDNKKNENLLFDGNSLSTLDRSTIVEEQCQTTTAVSKYNLPLFEPIKAELKPYQVNCNLMKDAIKRDVIRYLAGKKETPGYTEFMNNKNKAGANTSDPETLAQYHREYCAYESCITANTTRSALSSFITTSYVNQNYIILPFKWPRIDTKAPYIEGAQWGTGTATTLGITEDQLTRICDKIAVYVEASGGNSAQDLGDYIRAQKVNVYKFELMFKQAVVALFEAQIKSKCTVYSDGLFPDVPASIIQAATTNKKMPQTVIPSTNKYVISLAVQDYITRLRNFYGTEITSETYNSIAIVLQNYLNSKYATTEISSQFQITKTIITDAKLGSYFVSVNQFFQDSYNNLINSCTDHNSCICSQMKGIAIDIVVANNASLDQVKEVEDRLVEKALADFSVDYPFIVPSQENIDKAVAAISNTTQRLVVSNETQEAIIIFNKMFELMAGKKSLTTEIGDFVNSTFNKYGKLYTPFGRVGSLYDFSQTNTTENATLTFKITAALSGGLSGHIHICFTPTLPANAFYNSNGTFKRIQILNYDYAQEKLMLKIDDVQYSIGKSDLPYISLFGGKEDVIINTQYPTSSYTQKITTSVVYPSSTNLISLTAVEYNQKVFDQCKAVGGQIADYWANQDDLEKKSTALLNADGEINNAARSITPPVEKISRNSEGGIGEYLFTLFYYDKAGNLIKTVAPKGAIPNQKKKYESKYTFNSRNLPISENTPDAGTNVMSYDAMGKLLSSTNANGLTTRYTYDPLYRLINTTEKKSDNSVLCSVVQTYGNTLSGATETGTLFSLSNTMGRIKRSSTTTNGTHDTYYSYDPIGNVQRLIQYNPQLGSKTIDYTYDLISGKVNTICYQKDQADQFFHRYRYDADNRLVAVQTSRDGYIWNNDATYAYYPHGPLARTQLGVGINYPVVSTVDNKKTLSFTPKIMQGLDYYYTTQGWMKGVNGGMLDLGHDGEKNAFQNSEITLNDAMSYKLDYYSGDYTPTTGGDTDYKLSTTLNLTNSEIAKSRDLYNGNISSIFMSIRGMQQQSFFDYDQLQRVRLVRHSNIIGNYAFDYSYDYNGNITAQSRYLKGFGRQRSLTPTGDYFESFITIPEGYYDALNYLSTSETNRLESVFDAASNNIFDDDLLNTAPESYTYYNNGSLKTRTAFNSTTATFNVHTFGWTASDKLLNVEEKTPSGTTVATALYAYDANGGRIQKSLTASNASTTTSYVRDAQGNVLASYSKSGTNPMALDELYIYGSTRLSSLTPGNNVRHYELSDHRGNVVCVINDRLRNNYPQYDQIVSYEPFGRTISGASFYRDPSNKYDFGFQRQENASELFGGKASWFKYRISDNRLGRFFTIDPLTKKYPHNSPYAFSENRVIDRIELEGLESANYFIGMTQLSSVLQLHCSGKEPSSQAFQTAMQEDASATINYARMGTVMIVGPFATPLFALNTGTVGATIAGGLSDFGSQMLFNNGSFSQRLSQWNISSTASSMLFHNPFTQAAMGSALDIRYSDLINLGKGETTGLLSKTLFWGSKSLATATTEGLIGGTFGYLGAEATSNLSFGNAKTAASQTLKEVSTQTPVDGLANMPGNAAQGLVDDKLKSESK